MALLVLLLFLRAPELHVTVRTSVQCVLLALASRQKDSNESNNPGKHRAGVPYNHRRN